MNTTSVFFISNDINMTHIYGNVSLCFCHTFPSLIEYIQPYVPRVLNSSLRLTCEEKIRVMEGRRKQTRSETVLLQLQQQDHLFNICAPDVAQNWGWWNSFLSRKQCLPSVNYVIPIMCRKANLWQNYAYLFTEWRNYIYCLLLLFSTDLKLYLRSAQFSRFPPWQRASPRQERRASTEEMLSKVNTGWNEVAGAVVVMMPPLSCLVEKRRESLCRGGRTWELRTV